MYFKAIEQYTEQGTGIKSTPYLLDTSYPSIFETDFQTVLFENDFKAIFPGKVEPRLKNFSKTKRDELPANFANEVFIVISNIIPNTGIFCSIKFEKKFIKHI